MQLTVQEIYKYNREHSYKMLSAFTSADTEVDFWKEYKDNYNYFDRLFMKTYRSFIAFNAEGDEVDEVSDDFRADVYSWLMANDKRYSELYRVQLLTNEELPVAWNYDLNESYAGSMQRSGSETEGSRTDSGTDSKTYGAKSTTRDYDETRGAHTDNIEVDNSYGAQSNSGGKTLNYGAVSTTDEQLVSAFNDSGYVGKEKNTHDTLAREDSETTSESLGAHSDSLDTESRYGAQTNTQDETISELAHTDSGTTGFTKGSQSNTSSETGQDSHVLRRYGNIGVATASDIISGFTDLWQAFSFYKIIFDDIANEFLRV